MLMKILLYTYDIMKIGGIETSFYHLAQYLHGKGHDVGVRYSQASPEQVKRYKDAGIDIQHVKQEKCDVLFIGSIWRQPVLITARIKVQQCHADWSDEFWKGAGSALQMIHKAEKTVDVFACVSESAANFVRKATDKPVVVMNNIAPELSDIEKRKHKGSVFAAFTRMTREKGKGNYVDFRNRILELGINAEFRAYTNGEAPEGWELFETVTDIRTELPEIDYVVSLADTESFGYAIAEANSAAVPAIIKRTNSTAEFFLDTDNLILDDVSSFTKKDLSRKINSYQLRVKTEQSVDDMLKYLEKYQKSHCIIRTRRQFYDIDAQKKRVVGEVFSTSKKRGKELLKHKLKLVEEI